MRGPFAFASLAGLVLAALPLSAQQPVRIDPEEARQCAIWASFLSTEMADDTETAQALLFAVNYFIGQYEGATGRSIADGDDIASALQMATNMEQVTEMCTAHMSAYGDRMIAWGDNLQAIGDRGPK